MIYWAPLLHFYQPPTQTHWVLDKVSDEAYRPLIEIFRNNPKAKVTANVCAALTELLIEHGKSDIVEGLAELAERGQLEFTGSAKYHPILPLLPQEEVARQIALNTETNRRYFGPSFAPRGFLPPEMCYSGSIAGPIQETGHEWLILSGIACPNEWPLDTIHEIRAPQGTLAVFFRDDVLSNMIAFRNVDAPGFLSHLAALRGTREDLYVVTAMDAETFGHHIKSWEKLFLEEVYDALNSEPMRLAASGLQQLRKLVDRQKKVFSLQAEVEEIQAVTVSELLDLFRRGANVEPKPSSWSTMEYDLKANNPYPLWNAPDNLIHQLLWEHLDITIHMVKKAGASADNETSRSYADMSRMLLDRALHSDQFWWASRRPNWDINLINRGLMQQHEALLNGYKAITTCDAVGPEERRQCRYLEVAARDVRVRVHEQLFAQHP